MGGIYNTGNFHLYDYAGNNPVKLRIQRENLITLQFFRVAVQIFGGGIEVTAGLLAEGVSVGVSTYAVIDGIYNVADGIIGMTAAACDKKYDGAIPEVASAIAEKTGATKEQQEAIAAVAGLADAVIDAKATAGLSLVAKGKTANALAKGVKTVDKINDVTGKASLANQGVNTVKEGIDVVNEAINNNQNKKVIMEKQNKGGDE